MNEASEKDRLRAQVDISKEIADLVGKVASRDRVERNVIKVRLKQVGALRAGTYTRATPAERENIRAFLQACLATGERRPRICVCLPGRHEPTCPDQNRPPRGTFVRVTEETAVSNGTDDPDARKREDYIDGLRQLADLLQENPHVPLPYSGNNSAMTWILLGSEQRETLAAIAKALPGKVEKSVREQDGAFDLKGQLAGLKLQVIADRDQVCKRVVVGTREVTETVPDPSVTVPKVEVTRTVEEIEWVCTPLLAGGDRG